MLEKKSSARSSRGTRGISRRLSARRRKHRRWLAAGTLVLLLLLFGLLIWGFWRPAVRITKITVSGSDDSVVPLAQQTMRGTYLYIFPRNSAFFYPASRIRREILASDPRIAAVSIKRVGAAGLHITVTDRVAVARWCGADDSAVFQQCYVFDPSGFVFATTSPLTRLVESLASSTATSSPHLQAPTVPLVPVLSAVSKPLDPYVMYEPLATSSVGPIGATLPNAAVLPDVFSFAQQLAPFGSSVRSIAIQDGEVDDTLVSGTIVKYVLGQESQALSSLTSARADFNLSDGSLEYVDLRFGGKVYVKKRGNN